MTLLSVVLVLFGAGLVGYVAGYELGQMVNKRQAARWYDNSLAFAETTKVNTTGGTNE